MKFNKELSLVVTYTNIDGVDITLTFNLRASLEKAKLIQLLQWACYNNIAIEAAPANESLLIS